MTQEISGFSFLYEIKKHKIAFLKSCGFYACFLLIGLNIGIVGPTLIDLAVQTSTDVTRTALILPFRAGGYVVSTKSILKHIKLNFSIFQLNRLAPFQHHSSMKKLTSC